MTRIRPMTESDGEQVATILADCYRLMAANEGLSDEQLHCLLTERCTAGVVREAWLKQWDCHVAESATGVAGALAIADNEIGELFVLPSHRRKGVGAALYQCNGGS